MITEGSHYLIDETENAYCIETNRKDTSKRVILDRFIKNCSSDNNKRAFCQIDKDSDEMVKYGMTTFGVETKDQVLITIGIHENNYESCKEELMELQNSVKRAEAKIVDKKDDIKMNIKKFAIAATLLVGGFALVKAFNGNTVKPNTTEDTAIEQTTEQPTEEQNISYDELNKIQVLPNVQDAAEKQVTESEQQPMVFYGEEDHQQNYKGNAPEETPNYTQMYEGIDIHTPEGVKQANDVNMQITQMEAQKTAEYLRNELQNGEFRTYPNPMPDDENVKKMN